ncbi:twin-arginine translocase TatA/TatE family subunit [Paenibacillus sp. PAMC21692]|uniref:twin-arginine translocase TatA/TatE family subunit n=1 Tax=Paenibacillus sp. PAMC21692 TaxID=2762320 RepID=UPI00164E2359|nr:twin-arginine translocase TatA/TatE family subunit [Paenibacillus sp. PAMC21692]QNK54875.1 twin-arginine translocase TatA/TatE family subunit [Paenibacillus sp. PAMC21692]
MAGIGVSGIVLLALILLLFFGPNKLPELAKAFGRTMREFKKGANELLDDQKQASRVDVSLEQQEQLKAERRLPD